MTNKYIQYLLFCLVFLAVSCQNALIEEPTAFYSEDSVFASEEAVETIVNGMYSELSNYDYYGSGWHSFITPTSGLFYSSQVANVDGTSLNTDPSNPQLGKLWGQAYATINVANIIIENLTNKETELENAVHALGQAHFIRGMVYLDLTRFFGAVPLRVVPTDLESIHQSKANQALVIEQIEADLILAKDYLATADFNTPAKASVATCNAYLARLYMYLAGRDGGEASYWGEAKTVLLEIYNSQQYQLTPTYAELFEPNNENTSEAIFELQYDHTGGLRNSDIVRVYTPANSLLAPANTVTFGRIRPNKEVFDAHLTRYPDDPRLAATHISGAYERLNGTTQKIYPEKTTGKQAYTLIRKWLDPSYNGTTTSRNYILVRYADILLMLAEVENEINGPDAAYDFVNQVVARARDVDGDGMSDTTEPADWTDMDQATFRENILLERQFELLSEGQDWFDGRRRGYEYFLEKIVSTHNNHPTLDPDTDYIYSVSVKNMLLPIPLVEISGNQMISSADQNPGY